MRLHRESAGDGTQPAADTTSKSKRSPGARIARGAAWIVSGLVLFLIAVVGALYWYTTTAGFQHRARNEFVSVIENATGGRVDLGQLQFSIRHLSLEADNLVVHGLEGPGEAPYLSVPRILVRIEIISFFQHATGTGLASHIGLNLLRVEHPEFHLIIDKDGHTNQPIPKRPRRSKQPIQDTLLDLKAAQMQLVDGVALLNDRAIPFDATAANVNVEVRYLASTDRYGVTLNVADLRTTMNTARMAHSHLYVEGELGRDLAQVKYLEFDSGANSVLHATAVVNHFAQPTWQATLKGSLDLKQLSVLTAFTGPTGGALELAINGHSCAVSRVLTQPPPKLWQRLRPRHPAEPNRVPPPPDPGCPAGYVVAGTATLHDAGYADEYIRLSGINGGAQLHITPSELRFTGLTGSLPGGGSASGELRIVNWLGDSTAATGSHSPPAKGVANTSKKTAATSSVSPARSRVAPAHAYLTATVDRIPLRTIMEATETSGYSDIGFDTAVSGPVKAEWGGAVADIADTVVVDGELTFKPTGVLRHGVSNVPVSGQALAHYDGKREVVQIQRVQLNSLGSSLSASGLLGVNLGDPLTDLAVNLTVHHLSEFDQLLQSLGFAANGKRGAAAIPVVLHGAVAFEGIARGRVEDLDVKGHVQGENVEVHLGDKIDTQVDSFVADAEYSFESGLAVASSTVRRNTAVLNAVGTLKPRPVIAHAGLPRVVWDSGTTIAAHVQLANASVADVLQISGQQDKIPLTGTIALSANVNGPLAMLNGQGNISITKGTAYGEPYDSVLVTLAVKGEDIEASSAAFSLDGMHITGNGGYDLSSKHLHGHIQGEDLVLSEFHRFAAKLPGANAVLSLVADANGTVEQPGLIATVKLAKVTMDAKPIGDVSASLHSEGTLLNYTMRSTLVGAKVDLAGGTQLTGNYETQARLTLAGFDVATPIEMFSASSLKARSSIGGTIVVNGPAKTPEALSGTAEFNDFDVKLEGIELKSTQAIHLSLANGIATLAPFHISGQDTDLEAGGTVQVFGATGPNGGRVNMNASGGLNTAIAHVFDPDILSSGKVTFQVAARGQVRKPALSGHVRFEDVNAAMDGVPNGLTALTGSLVFNQDRLNVESLTATTGGGKVKIGGFLTYDNGLEANLTATGDAIRVRMYGLSTTANANLRLQGSPQSLLLSGSLLITRFDIGPNIDFAAFSSGAGGLTPPPDPSDPSNKIRLDVHVTSSPQLDFQNSYAQLAGRVDLSLRGTVAEPALLGRIQITEGSATFSGTKYQLQRGDIYFNNPVRIDPVVDLDVMARVETYDITVGLHGTASNLKPTYRSEPPLSESDIFNLLALGRTEEEAQINNEFQAQQGADPTTTALLGGALNATVSSRVSKLFGGGSVKIDPSFVGTLGNSSARITVQQQLTPQLSITYATNVNYTAQQLIEGEFDFTPNVSLIVQRDETGVFSVVYRIRRRYR